MVKKAVFFDRDGVINYLVKRPDGSLTAPWSIAEFVSIPGAKQAVQLVKDMGYMVFVVTNQPDVYDDKLSIHHLEIMNRMLKAWFGVDDVMCAFERGSAWYKPNNGMIETLIRQYKIDRSQSYIIGDRWKDIAAGHKSKLTTIYIGDNYTKEKRPENIFSVQLIT